MDVLPPHITLFHLFIFLIIFTYCASLAYIVYFLIKKKNYRQVFINRYILQRGETLTAVYTIQKHQ